MLMVTLQQMLMMNKKNNLQSQVDIKLNRYAWRTQKEFPLDIDAIDTLLFNKGALTDEPAYSREEYQERREKMVNDLFVAATKVLTEIQFQFFTSYYVLGMSETQVADSFHVTQPYVSIVLSASAKKIRKHLNIV